MISVNLEELVPYGHLFYLLQFSVAGRTNAYGQPILNLLTSCSNLKKLEYVGSDGEQDALVMTALQDSCPLLEELELRNVSLNQQQSAGPVFLIPTNRNCKHLRTLTVFSCDVASGSAIQRIAEIESLKELKLYDCGGLSDADLAVLATMSLVDLTLRDFQRSDWRAASLQCLVGSNISQTLEYFDLQVWRITQQIDDVQVATPWLPVTT